LNLPAKNDLSAILTQQISLAFYTTAKHLWQHIYLVQQKKHKFTDNHKLSFLL